MTHTWLDELDKTSWACSEFFQAHPWVTKVLIIAPGLPMGENFSKKLLTRVNLVTKVHTVKPKVHYNIISSSNADLLNWK
jgi:hypothetical protein